MFLTEFDDMCSLLSLGSPSEPEGGVRSVGAGEGVLDTPTGRLADRGGLAGLC